MNIRGFCFHVGGRDCVMCRATVTSMNTGMRDSDAPPPTPYPNAPPLKSTTLAGETDAPPHDPTVDTGPAKGTESGEACVKDMSDGRD